MKHCKEAKRKEARGPLIDPPTFRKCFHRLVATLHKKEGGGRNGGLLPHKVKSLIILQRLWIVKILANVSKVDYIIWDIAGLY